VVEEGEEGVGAVFAEEVDEGPGLGVGVGVVAVFEALVTKEGVEGGRSGEFSPLGESAVVESADASPAAAADDLELGGEALVKPDGEVALAGGELGEHDELVDEFVGGGAEVELESLGFHEEVDASGLAFELVEPGLGLGAGDGAWGFALEAKLESPGGGELGSGGLDLVTSALILVDAGGPVVASAGIVGENDGEGRVKVAAGVGVRFGVELAEGLKIVALGVVAEEDEFSPGDLKVYPLGDEGGVEGDEDAFEGIEELFSVSGVALVEKDDVGALRGLEQAWDSRLKGLKVGFGPGFLELFEGVGEAFEDGVLEG
jgi:hypothetical protein